MGKSQIFVYHSFIENYLFLANNLKAFTKTTKKHILFTFSMANLVKTSLAFLDGARRNVVLSIL